MQKEKKLFQNKYGYFNEDGTEYVITRPDTPRPWANVICPGDYGVVLSQTGSGYSWKTHAGFNRITRWEQDLIKDEWGKYIYIRDNKDTKYWSLGWKPVCAKPQFYECRHGIGYSTIKSINNRIKSEMTVFVPPTPKMEKGKDESMEIWIVKLKNESSMKRSLSLWTYFEWCLGVTPDWHREFHKIFIETEFDTKNNAMLAGKRLWTIRNKFGHHNNRDWEYKAFHSSSMRPVGYEGDKEKFLGRYGTIRNPAAVEHGRCSNSIGKYNDGVASLQVNIELEPHQEKTIVFTLGAVKDKKEAIRLIKKYNNVSNAQEALDRTIAYWKKCLDVFSVDTPDKAFNLMSNIWLKYQALSGRYWGRNGYYQVGGAFGFRDQLQDSQIFLELDPGFTRKHILYNTSHQFKSGIVHHWWHAITERGSKSKYSDDLLWLPFVTINYLKETNDFSILKEKVPYYDDDTLDTLYIHIKKVFEVALSRVSKRGLPLILEGDWNDGLCTVGYLGKGETIWLGHFLVGILRDWSEVIKRAVQHKVIDDKQLKLAELYTSRSETFKEKINKYAWDGKWYIRATCDDGSVIGSSKCREGKIFLNAQTWSVIHQVASPERAETAMNSVEKLLDRDYGPVLLYPAYQKVDEYIGYITRYAPGVRENGGVYTHGAVWTIIAECMLGRGEKAYSMYKKMCPVYRGMNPDKYIAEPYVTPGNTDGPVSPHYGRGGWTWYTGSAAWLFRAAAQWIIGVRPDYDGLIISPCLPKAWKKVSMRRVFRGAVYDIEIANPRGTYKGIKSVSVDGNILDSNIIPEFNDGKEHKVVVKLG